MDTQQFRNGKRITGGDGEMLSLMVNEAIKGVDIETRYPDFYQKLLRNAALRQAFLDTLEMLEAGKAGELIPLPAGERPRLGFLQKKTPRPAFPDAPSWKITLNRTIQDLKSIFSPPQLAYRADANLFEENWFTILRDDIELGGSSYSVLLECGISKETEDALSATLNIAISMEKLPSAVAFPVSATLRWGEYSATLTLPDEGRVRFPDIPFYATFDPQNQEIISGLDLVLETSLA